MFSKLLISLSSACLWLMCGGQPCHADGRLGDEEAFMNLWARAKPETAPPFELPDTLPGGGVKMFHRAESRAAYEYSRGGRVHVCRYDQPEVAAADFAVFAKSNERVDDKASALLAKQGACLTREKDSVTLWFLMDETIVGLQTPADQWSAPAVVKTAETLVKSENDRIAQWFGEPERAVTTFIKAVEKIDEPRIMRALSAGDDDDARKRLEQMKNYLPMLRLMMMERMGHMGGDEEEKPVRVGRAEKTAAGRVFVPVRAEFVGEDMPWFALLLFAAGREQLAHMGGIQRGGDEPLWIPVAQVGTRWAIDVSTLRQSMFSKTVQTAQDRDCFGNMRQILLALKAAATDDIQTQKFPEKFSHLVTGEYVTDMKIFRAPGSNTKFERATDVDEKSDYIYEGAGQVDTGDGDFIIVYDKPGMHEGQGRHVGFADGHLQWVDESKFERMLANQRKALKPAPPGR